MNLPAWDEVVDTETWSSADEPTRRELYREYLRELSRTPTWKSFSGEDKFNVAREMEKVGGFYKEEKPPGFTEGLGSTAARVLKEGGKGMLTRAAAIPETGMALASGMMNAVVKPFVEYTKMAQGESPEEARRNAEYASSTTTYRPFTEEGQITSEMAGNVLGLPFLAAKKLYGEPAAELVRFSNLSKAIKNLGGQPEMITMPLEEAITFGLGAKGVSTIGRGIKGLGDSYSELERLADSFNKPDTSIAEPILERTPTPSESVQGLPLVKSNTIRLGKTPPESPYLRNLEGAEYIGKVTDKRGMPMEEVSVLPENPPAKLNIIERVQMKAAAQNLYNEFGDILPTWDEARLRKMAESDPILWDGQDMILMRFLQKPSENVQGEPLIEGVEGYRGRTEPTEVPKPPEPGVVPGGKQPWEMTKQEYMDSIVADMEARIKAGENPENVLPPERTADNTHYAQVKRALSEGKPVPPEVLKDYPKLAKEKSTDKPDVKLLDITSLLNPRIAGEFANKAWKATTGDVTKYAEKIPNRDLKTIRRLLNDAQFLAKADPVFDKFYQRHLQRNERRNTEAHTSLSEVKSVFDLSKEDTKALGDLIFDLEGKKVIATDKYDWDVVEGRGGYIRTQNEGHYEGLRDYLSKQYSNVPEPVREAYIDLRRSFDHDLMNAYNRQYSIPEVSDNTIQSLRSALGEIENYFPHHRYGDKFIEASRPVPGGREVGFRQHFYEFPFTEFRGSRLLKEAQTAHPDLIDWKYGKTTQIPEELFEYPIPLESMQEIIDLGINRMDIPEIAKDSLRELMPQATSDILKLRGWGSHMLHRKNIPGFETQDIKKIIVDYKSGLYGALEKMDAARDYRTMYRDLKPIEESNRYSAITRFVKDSMRNSDAFDRSIDNARAALYMYYIGGVVKTGGTNLTQNITMGIPRLSMETHVASLKYLNSVFDDVLSGIRGDRQFTPEENSMLNELYNNGTIRDQQAREFRAHAQGQFGPLLNKTNQIAGLTMSIPERFNRFTLALASFRVARKGQVINSQTLNKYGYEKRQPFSYEDAVKFSEEIVNDAHLIYDKASMPEWARGSKAGAVGRLLYTLSSFSHKYMQLLEWMSHQERGGQAIVKSILGTLSLGGVRSLPFSMSIMAAARKQFGKDIETDIRKSVPDDDDDLYGDLIMYGLPSLVGVDMSGSLLIDIHNPDNPLLSITGVPGSFASDIYKSSKYLESGQPGRALEQASPLALRHPQAAYRGATEGLRKITGEPVNYPGETEPLKLNKWEAIAKGFGFQATKISNLYSYQNIMNDLQTFAMDKKRIFANKYVTAINGNDEAKITAIQNEIDMWNQKWLDADKPEFTINLRDAIKERMRINQPAKRFRSYGEEAQGEYRGNP